MLRRSCFKSNQFTARAVYPGLEAVISMRIRHIPLFLLLTFSLFNYNFTLQAQEARPGKWLVRFTDKSNSPYSIHEPAKYLSARSIERRQRMGIPIVENDLPVNPGYIQGLEQAGAKLHNKSKWLNAATVIADSAAVRRMRELPFVRSVQYVARDISIKNPANHPPKKRVYGTEYTKETDHPFGYSIRQQGMLGMPMPYMAGARGEGIWIAVMDGGFINADSMPFFDSLAIKGKLIEGWDFVERDRAVFESASHGTSVLSVMGANMPGYFLGTAPEAHYFLLKTEDTGGEYPVEECNWIAGAEWADSIGVDVINASLGYTIFNDPKLGHRYEELDGKSTIGAEGAGIAATKGMIICNSAGNSGDEPWKYVGVPADAPGIIAVGASSPDMQRASFSSVGPTADGRIKPDLMAPGEMVVTAGYSGSDLGFSNGTSLASPLLAGAIASLWSDYPDKSDQEILDVVFKYADHPMPDTAYGYGMPNMTISWLDLGGYGTADYVNHASDAACFSMKPARGDLALLFLTTPEEQPQSFRIRNLKTGTWTTLSFQTESFEFPQYFLSSPLPLQPGSYQLQMLGEHSCVNLWVIKTE